MNAQTNALLEEIRTKLNEEEEKVPAKNLDLPTQLMLKKLGTEFKKRGWKYQFHKQSASGEWGWSKGERGITLAGWHGTGNWGDGKVVNDILTGVGTGRIETPWEAKYPSSGGKHPAHADDAGRLWFKKDVDYYIKKAIPEIVNFVMAYLKKNS